MTMLSKGTCFQISKPFMSSEISKRIPLSRSHWLISDLQLVQIRSAEPSYYARVVCSRLSFCSATARAMKADIWVPSKRDFEMEDALCILESWPGRSHCSHHGWDPSVLTGSLQASHIHSSVMFKTHWVLLVPVNM